MSVSERFGESVSESAVESLLRVKRSEDGAKRCCIMQYRHLCEETREAVKVCVWDGSGKSVMCVYVCPLHCVAFHVPRTVFHVSRATCWPDGQSR